MKYSKLFTITGAITHEPVTILVEYIEADGFKCVSIDSVEGEYASTEEFEKNHKLAVDKTEVGEDKIYNFLPMTVPDTQLLIDTLTEAIVASKKAEV